MRAFDFVVIGGGSAGYAAARTAVAEGLKTAVIDGAETLSGLCILRGCMPSKTLIESANRFRVLRHAREFGLRAREISVRPEEIIARKRRLIAEFAQYRTGQLETEDFTLIRGQARYVSPTEIAVKMRDGGEERVQARTSVIATGSRIAIPELAGLEDAGYLTSDDVLDAVHLPESVIVLGGGPVAVELAHYYEGLGRRVTLIQRSHQLMKSIDADMAECLRDALGARGIDVRCGTRLLRVERDGEREKAVVFEQEGESGEQRVVAEDILVATGRAPLTGELGLEAAGVRLDSRGGVETGVEQRTSAPHVFAAGDAGSPFEIVHVAIEQGEVAAHNAARWIEAGTGKDGGAAPVRRMDYRLKLFGIFCQPELAVVGMSAREAEDARLDPLVATYPFDDHGKSLVSGETEGFVKLIAARDSGEILGGGVIGPHAVELIHEVVVAMRFRATAGDLATTPHYHPTLSEIWTYPAEEIADTVTGCA